MDIKQLKQQKETLEKELAVKESKVFEYEKKVEEVKQKLIDMGYSEEFLQDKQKVQEEVEKLETAMQELMQELKKLEGE